MKLRQGFMLRLALIGDLFVYTLGLMLFAVLPLFGEVGTNPLTDTEIIIAVLGLPALYGLVGRLLLRPWLWGNEWAYLYLGGYAITMLATFYTVGQGPVEWPANVIVGVWFASGIVGAFGAHILDGSKEPLTTRYETWSQ